ncbi:MAG: excinuclease ABC subunit UvrC, partial [Lachnospiraceae bacterium]|nr:excinuclease ABC subunit UvrC [Lachnospiraceae bacterium]
MSDDFNIEENLKKLPKKPGVYIMHNDKDEIIYVGKAINLFNRVHSYFRNTKKSAKITKMVTHIHHFEYIVTDSELEALVLECNLIKTHRPPYNTMLRDDKSYPYIKVTINEEYPRIMFARKAHGDTGENKSKSKFFGPYTSSYGVRETIELINKIYMLRTCNRVLPRDIDKERPCLNYQIHQCQGPCRSGCTDKEQYMEGVKGALDFLEGNYKPIIKMLEEKMYKASDAMEFEEAAAYRDLLNSVNSVAQKQRITNSDGEDRDVIGLARDKTQAVVAIFFVRDGRIIGRDHFYIKEDEEVPDAEIIGSFVKQFYSGTPLIPPQIIVEEDIEDREITEEWLTNKRGMKVSIIIPKRGDKEKLTRLAKKNAEIVLNTDRDKLEREEQRTVQAAQGIADLIGIGSANRIESYDISNISGFESVGSMVVFENGKAKKSDYRKFKIKTVKGPNDYASMEEVLTRRFTRLANAKGDELKGDAFTRYPDLILMDGGRGQVNIALEVLDRLHLTIPVAGMVKDDHHRTRGIYYNNVEQPIDSHSESFHLVTRIQDETHRFAITYHRNLRSNAQIKSILDDIKGVGEQRRKALLMEFGSVEAVAAASVEELAAAPSMNEQIARSVW